MDTIKKQVEEIVEIVKLCPENLQEKCFEILLTATLQPQRVASKPVAENKLDETAEAASTSLAQKINSGEEIEAKNLHTKAKRIVPQELSLEEVNNLFYIEDGEFLPLYDDLKSPKVAEAQIRVALMEALKNGLKNGDFSFSFKAVRSLCETYKCYDLSNYASNFKNNKSYFVDDYSTNGTTSLTSEGKKEMVKVAKELAK